MILAPARRSLTAIGPPQPGQTCTAPRISRQHAGHHEVTPALGAPAEFCDHLHSQRSADGIASRNTNQCGIITLTITPCGGEPTSVLLYPKPILFIADPFRPASADTRLGSVAPMRCQLPTRCVSLPSWPNRAMTFPEA